MTRAPLLYRWLLRLLPAELRESCGREIEDLAASELAAAQALGRWAYTRAWCAAIWDVLRRAPLERWRARHRNSREELMGSLWLDLRFAVRSLSRQKGATALILVALSLAVAANAGVFALLNGLFFRPFPFPEAQRLVNLNEQAPRWNLEFTGVNYPDFDAWQRNTRVFQAMALIDETRVNVNEGGAAERVDGAMVTRDLPRVLGIDMVLGRTFSAEEDRPNGPAAVVIGYGLWQSRYGGSRDVLGKTLRINSAPYTIVGVLPREGEFPNGAQLWLPMAGDPNQTSQSYGSDGIARLKPGVSIEQARSDLLRAQEPIWAQRDTARVVSPRIMPLRDRYVADYRDAGKALGFSVTLVLLIACANVAGTMLARATFRRRELALRMALGAGMSRVARQFLTEALLLSAIAAAIGILLGWWGMRVLVRGFHDLFPVWMHLGLDWRFVLFSVAIVGTTAVLFGLVPAFEMPRREGSVRETLAEGDPRGTASRGQRRTLDTLVVVEIALAAVLLVGGGLMARTYEKLLEADPGFRAEGVASFRLALPEAIYRDGRDQLRFYDRLLERIREIPGVTAAGAVTCPPFTCHWGNFYDPEGGMPNGPDGADPVVLTRIASDGYFAAMGITLTRGRFYGPAEGGRNAFPVVINEELGHRLWPGVDDPLGRRLRTRGDTTAPWMTVVGVVHDVKHYGLARPMRPGLYIPMATMDSARSVASFAFFARTTGDPAALFGPMRDAVRQLDPELPLYSVQTMSTALAESLAPRRILMLLLGSLAAIALTLAVSGIYAVLSYLVGRRRREIGIRLALGARQDQVLKLVLRQAARLIGIGLALGVPAAYVASRLMSSQLVGVAPSDLFTYLAAVLVVAVTGFASALAPARRAAKVHPRVTLDAS